MAETDIYTAGQDAIRKLHQRMRRSGVPLPPEADPMTPGSNVAQGEDVYAPDLLLRRPTTPAMTAAGEPAAPAWQPVQSATTTTTTAPSSSTSTSRKALSPAERQRVLTPPDTTALATAYGQRATVEEQAAAEENRLSALEAVKAWFAKTRQHGDVERYAKAIDEETTALAKQQIEPGRVWAKGGGGGTILAIIASAIGGAGAALARMGTNPVLDAIDQAIDRDIDAQRAKLMRAEHTLGTKRQRLSEMRGDAKHAEELYRIATIKKSAAAIGAMRAKGVRADYAAKLAEVQLGLEQRAAERIVDLAPQVQSTQSTGGTQTSTVEQSQMMVPDQGPGMFADIDVSDPEAAAKIAARALPGARTGEEALKIMAGKKAAEPAGEVRQQQGREAAFVAGIERLKKLLRESPGAYRAANAAMLAGDVLGGDKGRKWAMQKIRASPDMRRVVDALLDAAQAAGYKKSGANVPEFEMSVITQFLSGATSPEEIEQRLTDYLGANLVQAKPREARTFQR